MEIREDITLEIAGLGIIMYSPSWACHVAPGANYLAANYESAEQVQPHIQAGTIVGFGTGSSGTFVLALRSGYPPNARLAASR